MRKKDKKRDAKPEEGFLNTAARAVGSTLGKLAAKTGLMQDEKPSTPSSGIVTRRKMKTVAEKRIAIAKSGKPPKASATKTKASPQRKTKRKALKTGR